VAEDHQTKNALALSNKQAAITIADKDARTVLIDKALEIIHCDECLKSLSENISRLAQRNSSDRIVDEIEKLLRQK
jgi:UDP-N-acetylglucosamine--N-acetylmuramyl-(pentapeptide) pyrophosphoryl-undecaprenol N-acetylglucosamine transferase